jgi:hypothetical protein
MDRDQKINIIKGLVSGEINPTDIVPKKLIIDIRAGEYITYSINDEPVTNVEFNAQHDKQYIQDDESTYPEIIVDGISMNDPEYHAKTVAKGIANGTIRWRQIGVNNFESY